MKTNLDKLYDSLFQLEGIVGLAHTVSDCQMDSELSCQVAGGMEAAIAIIKSCYLLIDDLKDQANAQ